MSDVQPDIDEAVAIESAREISGKADWMQLNLQPLSAMHLVGLVQLTLKHPELPATSEAFARQVVEIGREYFADCPGVLQIIEAAGRAIEAERAARHS